MAWQALKLHGKIEQTLHLRVATIFLPQFGDTRQCPLQIPRINGKIWHLLAQPVHLAITHLQNAPGIAQNSARFQLTEGDDLRDLACAIFFLHITDDLSAPRFAEVDIEIRHGNTVGVQEAFEQQTKLDRIKVRNGQHPRHERTRA